MNNNLGSDPCLLTLQQKRSFFEMLDGQNVIRQCRLPKVLSNLNIFPRKQGSSNNDNNNPTPIHTPSPETNSSSNGYPKKLSTSSPEVVTSASTNTTSSNDHSKNPTPSSESSVLVQSQPSTSNKSSKTQFHQSAQEILNEGKLQIPEILEVFTDLDRFIERELDEMSVRKRLEGKLNQSKSYDKVEDVFSKLKYEYLKDKEKYQKEFEQQKFDQNSKEDEDESVRDLTITSRLNFQRRKKIEKMNLEAIKQELLLSKINRVLDCAKKQVNDKNLAATVNLERHYLVAGSRFQSAFNEAERLQDPTEDFHSIPFHRKGSCVVSEIMLEVKSSYFERQNQIPNEFIVVLLKYDDQVFATNAVCITDDIRTIKFPQKFRISEAYMDFEMNLEIYGTTFWRKQSSIRTTMLKKYGSFNFTLVDSGSNRSRFEMLETIRSEHNPLKKKVLMKIRQKITAEVFFESNLELKLSDSWYKVHAVLCGNIIEITSLEDECEPMLLDLYNFETSFVIPVVSNVSKKNFTFMLKFNHFANGNYFTLLLAAETWEEYEKWINSINRVLVLIKN